MIHDRDGLPDPDPRVPAGWFDEPRPLEPLPPANPSLIGYLERPSHLWRFVIPGLALLLAAGVVVWWLR